MTGVQIDTGADLTALINSHYAALGGFCKDRDCHWSLSERWSYGEHAGWFVEHGGSAYDALDYGEEGPFPTREEAEIVMADHLRRAIAAIRQREGD